MKKQDIAEINSWWKFGKEFDNYDNTMKLLKKKPIVFHRDKIELQSGNIYIIRGPRQVGKTVWIKQTIKKLLDENINQKSIFYLSCDSLTGKTRKELNNEIRFFIDNVGMDKKPLYIFLDEITSVTDWNIELKTLVDSGLTENCVIVVTGSNPWEIKYRKERLPGRGVEGNEKLFFPLLFRDFVLQLKILPSWLGNENVNLIASLNKFYKEAENFIPANIENKDNVISCLRNILPYQKELSFLFQIYLRTGGIPESINSYCFNKYHSEKKEEKIDTRVYEQFINVVLGDLAKMVRNEGSLREVIDVVAGQQGNKYSFTNIVEKMSNQPDHKTVTTYTELLKETLLTRTFYSYGFNKMKNRPKADKKIYFYDPFLFYSVRGWLSGKEGYEVCSDTIMNDEILSNLIEGIIGHHIAATNEKLPMQDMITFLWLYYDKSREIDFLYKKKDDKFIGLEVKYQNNVSLRDMSIIDKINEYYLISKDTFELNNISIIPVHLFLFLLQKSDGHI